MPRSLLLPLLSAAFVLLSHSASSEVTFQWLTVGDPGNACDTQADGCFGSVALPYRISKFEVTNAQYSDFLNAVATTDTNALYDSEMGSGFGGITRSGSSGSFSYTPIAGREDLPVNYVSFLPSLRFANWLHNGQPTGAQDSSSTEDGAYTMIIESYPGSVITRNAGATIFLPSEDEWYKAAYYDAGSTSYFAYPAGSDTPTTCAVPGATANTANCFGVAGGFAGELTDGGSYTAAPSPSGTFDQGGNVFEWNEAILFGSNRGRRGGSFYFLFGPASLAAASRGSGAPSIGSESVGFRVGSLVPTPPVPSLSPLGVATLLGLVGAGIYRRLHTSP